MDLVATNKRHGLVLRKKSKNSLKKKLLTGVRGCNLFVAKENSPKTSAQLFNNFVDNTTLIGIPHILKKKSLFWLLAYITCMSLSIYQSWQSAVLLIEQTSHQNSAVRSEMKLPWPSITICNNVVLQNSYLNAGRVPGFKSYTQVPCNQPNYEDYIADLRLNNTLIVARYVRLNLTEEERKNQSLNRDAWIEKCTFSYDPCEYDRQDMFYEFNNPHDGNCITFNPNFGNRSLIQRDLDTKLIMHFRRFGSGYQLKGKKSFVSLLIHSPGTAPLMDLPEAIDIFSGQQVNVGLRLIQNDFMLKARTKIPTCVVETEEGDIFRKKSLYHTEETPYHYSVEACIKSCTQDKVNSPCNLLDATFPFMANKKVTINGTTSKYEDMVVDFPPITACNETEEVLVGLETCKCPFPCKLYKYTVSLDTTDYSANDNTKCKVKNDDNSDTRIDKMVVNIQFLSNIFDYNIEVLDFDLTQFLGFLGGNISLWLGLCVLSLLEVFELVWDLVVLKLKKTFGKKKGSQVTNYNEKFHHSTHVYPYGSDLVGNRFVGLGRLPPLDTVRYKY